MKREKPTVAFAISVIFILRVGLKSTWYSFAGGLFETLTSSGITFFLKTSFLLPVDGVVGSATLRLGLLFSGARQELLRCSNGAASRTDEFDSKL